MTKLTTNTSYRISLPAEVAEPLVDAGLARWDLSRDRSAADIADLAIVVGSSLGPVATVAVGKAMATEASRRIVQLFAEKWRVRRGETRLTVDLRARQKKVSLRVEIDGATDDEAVKRVLRALTETDTEDR